MRCAAPLIRTAGNALAPAEAGKRRLCIVNYHRILHKPDPLLDSEPTVDTFRWQMDLLASCFNVLPLGEAITRLGNGSLPPRAVAITFDDGYRTVHELALPILRERGLPATVFVTSGHIEDESSMWNDVILEAVRRSHDSAIDLRDIGMDVYPLADTAQCKASAAAMTERCKYLTPEARDTMLRRLQQLAREDLTQHLMLTADMIRELMQYRIEIGGHTVTHPILARLDDDRAFREIADGKHHLERVTGRPVELFAYPNGKQGVDFDQRHVEMVKSAGYRAAFTTAVGAASGRDHPYQLPRSRPWDARPLMFALRLLRWLGEEQ
nr:MULTISPECIES: polysaccharide deacetylase family protein [unclassified Massilia]